MCSVSKCSVYATFGVAILVFIGACNKRVDEGPVRAPRKMLALYDRGSAPCSEFREALSFSPSAAGVCLPMSPISLVLMLYQ